MRILTLHRILEFYDVPQLFVAKDTMGVNYLCLLYNENDGYEYLAVQISDVRLKAFVHGDVDLRTIYIEPELDDSRFHVLVKDKKIIADKMLMPGDVTDDMLPDSGFLFSADDAIEDSGADTFQITIPPKDRNFFADMARRMGWTMNTIKEASRRIAVM